MWYIVQGSLKDGINVGIVQGSLKDVLVLMWHIHREYKKIICACINVAHCTGKFKRCSCINVRHINCINVGHIVQGSLKDDLVLMVRHIAQGSCAK